MLIRKLHKQDQMIVYIKQRRWMTRKFFDSLLNQLQDEVHWPRSHLCLLPTSGNKLCAHEDKPRLKSISETCPHFTIQNTQDKILTLLVHIRGKKDMTRTWAIIQTIIGSLSSAVQGPIILRRGNIIAKAIRLLRKTIDNATNTANYK